MIRAVTTDYLSDAAKMIREEVFMREQGFRHEFDEIDAKAVCLVLYEESKPMACGRYFPGEADGEYVAGRLAVLREYRGCWRKWKKGFWKRAERGLFCLHRYRQKDFMKNKGMLKVVRFITTKNANISTWKRNYTVMN